MTYMMNTIIKQADLFPFDRIYGKYHLVTYNGDCGDDDKDYVNDLTEAKRLAKSYLKGDDITLPYEKVMVFNEIDNTLILVFDQYNKNGREPYSSEIANYNVKS